MKAFNLKQVSLLHQALEDCPFSTVIDEVSIDTRCLTSQNSLFIALKGSQSHGQQFLNQARAKGARFAIVEKNCSSQYISGLYLLKVDNPLKVLQEIALVYRKSLRAEFLCITGSYGKTMLKEILTDILSTHFVTHSSPESFNSQIGVALSIINTPPQTELAIIEAGISHEGEMLALKEMIQATYGILTNIGSAHLETLKNLATIAREKMSLFEGLESWLLCPKTPLISPKQTHFFWNEYRQDLPHAEYLSDSLSIPRKYALRFPSGEQEIFPLYAGQAYYLDLILIATKASFLLKVPFEKISKILKHYKALPTSKELWISSQRIRYLNDNFSQTPLNLTNSLKWLHSNAHPKGKKILAFEGFKHDQSPLNLSPDVIDELWVINNPSLYQSLKAQICPTFQASSLKAFFENVQLNNHDSVLLKTVEKVPLPQVLPLLKDPLGPTHLRINLTNVQYNLEQLRGQSRVMVMIKAMGYGTDSAALANFLHTCSVDLLGVSYVSEAMWLRMEGVQQEIFVIHFLPHEIETIIKEDLQVAISDLIMLEQLNTRACAQSKVVKVHLHIDTGMRRLGCSPKEALSLAKKIHKASHLHLEGVMTHFAVAEKENENSFTKEQIHCFEDVIKKLKTNHIPVRWVHLANTAGSLRWTTREDNLKRIGLGIFGLYPSKSCQTLVLKNALSLETCIASIAHNQKGQSIGYSRTYVSKKNERIAVLPIGYFDGIHQSFGNQGHVLIRGKKAPIVGAVCMDYMMVNITNIPEAEIGDRVLLFGEDQYGKQISVEEFAKEGNKSTYELITCLGPRVQRLFIYD